MLKESFRGRSASLRAVTGMVCVGIAALAPAFCHAAVTASSTRAAVTDDDAPATVNGKSVALTVTGEGMTNVKATGFSLNVTFYNDAPTLDAAIAQNVDAEAKLQKAAEQAGIKAGTINFPSGRVSGVPSTSYNPLGFGVQSGTPRSGETARAMRTFYLGGSNFAVLPSLLRALQSAGATGVVSVGYDFGDSWQDKNLRNQTLKKAVADAVAQAKVLETATLPRKLQILTIEPGDFSGPNNTLNLPLTPPKSSGGAPITPGQLASASAPTSEAHQSVVLRYAVVDAPTKPTAKPVAASKPAAPKAAPMKKG